MFERVVTPLAEDTVYVELILASKSMVWVVLTVAEMVNAANAPRVPPCMILIQ